MAKQVYKELAYQKLDDFIYASAKNPVTLKNGMVIGGGTMYPEINFTLPTMPCDENTWPEVIKHYTEIITGICNRARDLEVPGFVAEIEVLPPMTYKPEWGNEVCKVVSDIINEHQVKYGIKGAVRLTPVDIREGREVKHMWKESHWDRVIASCEGAAKNGATFVSIESVGGKGPHDEALMYCDIGKLVFALAVPACRDMEKLWTKIVEVTEKNGAIPAGDTACALANTAMVLAETNMIPRVYGAAVRVMNSVRSMVAMECGAKGPDKDCGYEGVYIKAITGNPISMEGRTAAGAHLSRVGNVAGCLCDIWSNESIQNIKLLSGMAPTAGFEQLVYDCRIMNGASAKGKDAALCMRDILADSDSKLDPHAYILRPNVVLDIAGGYVKEEGYYNRVKKAGELTFQHMLKGHSEGNLNLSDKEKGWAEKMLEQLDKLPKTEGELIDMYIDDCENFNPKHYDL